ncbi:MAG TPA: FxsA family protein [Planctomycetota bacterium]|nr:FxsA family protein [Planctomycetota bacterium]
MRMVGCLFVLVLIAVMCGELYLLLDLIQRTGEPFGLLLLMAVICVVGVKLTAFHAAKLPMAMMSGDLGRRMVAVIGGVLLVIPGFGTDVLGLLCQIPLVQRWFAGTGSRLGGALMRQAMERMGGGKFPGGGPGGGMPMFPGMQAKGGFTPLKPDEAAKFGLPPLPPKGKKPRDYDTTSEP